MQFVVVGLGVHIYFHIKLFVVRLGVRIYSNEKQFVVRLGVNIDLLHTKQFVVRFGVHIYFDNNNTLLLDLKFIFILMKTVCC